MVHRFKLTQLDDLGEAKAIHAMAFPDDFWAGDDHTYWTLNDERGRIAGMCSAVYREDKGYVYLSRAAVAVRFRGLGLGRRLIHARLRWARREGAPLAVTYTSLDNYDSMVNLLKCGFKFVVPPESAQFVGNNYHYFQRKL